MERRVKRNRFLDFIKGTTILLVVFGHCIQYGSGREYLVGELYYADPIFRIIYSFHMPMFAAISGYFFYFTMKKYDLVTLLKKKLLAYAVPIAVWAQIDLLLGILQNGNRIHGIVSFLLLEYQAVVGSLWFLWSMFGCCVIMMIFGTIVHREWKTGFLIVTIAAFFVLPDSLNLRYVKFLFPNFALGYAVSSEHVLQRLQRIPDAVQKMLLLAVFVADIILVHFFDKSKFIYTTGVSLLGGGAFAGQIYNDLYRWIAGMVGTICFVLCNALLYRLCCTHRLADMIAKVGQYSLGVYVFSVMLNRLFGYCVFVTNPSVLLWVVECIVITASSMLITYLAEKNKALRVLLLGKKN